MGGLDEILQGHIIMEGEAHNSMGLAGCCPNMIPPACSNYGHCWKGGDCEGMNSGSISTLIRI